MLVRGYHQPVRRQTFTLVDWGWFVWIVLKYVANAARSVEDWSVVRGVHDAVSVQLLQSDIGVANSERLVIVGEEEAGDVCVYDYVHENKKAQCQSDSQRGSHLALSSSAIVGWHFS